MSWWSDLAYRLKTLGRRARVERELDDELRFHLEMEIEQRVAAGESRARAARAARLAVGHEQAIKEECRDAWGTRLIDETRRDLRSAVRHFLRAPRFALVVIGSLAIGLGAAAVIFSVVDAVLLQPLPFGDPYSLVALQEVTPEGDLFSISDANLIDYAERSRSIDDIAAVVFPTPRPALLRDGDRVRLSGLTVTPSFFRVLGVPARLGRTFGSEESTPGESARSVVLSYAAWQEQLGGDPEAVGRKLDLDGELYVVIGVLPPGFRLGSDTVDVYLPYAPDPAYPRGDRRLDAIARLARGADLEPARREVAAIADQLGAEYPDSNAEWSAALQPIGDYFLGATARRTNWVLLGAAGLLLLLACVNVSNLLLARGSDRVAETRLRLALGAGRSRLLRQLLTESLLLGVLGGAAGLLLAYFVVPVVRRLEVALPRMDTMTLDARVIVFVLLVAVLCGLLFGLVPALRVTAQSAGDSLRMRPHGSDRRGARLRSVLVAAEVALATVLLVGAGLLLVSFDELRRVDSGFEPANVLLAQVDLPKERYPEGGEPTQRFFDELAGRLEAIPGVEAAGANIVSPFRGPSPTNVVATEGELERDRFVFVKWRSVTPHTFRALGIPLLRGRTFDESVPRLETVISAQLAGRLWPGEDPLGKSLRWNRPDGPLFEVVGVAGEVQDLRLGDAPPPTVYLPQRVIGWPTMTVVVKTRIPPEQLSGPVRQVVRELDPLLAAPAISTLDGHRREALAEPLLSLRLMSAFSAIALLLAAVGVYGIVSYAASRRRYELGLRTALGARPGQLARLVVGGGLWMVGGGLAAGVVGSLALVGTLRALLYQTSPFDPRVVAAALVVLGVVAVVASSIPALRAGRADPVGCLREE